MCGIFGLLAGKDAALGARRVEAMLAELFRLSESRGKEAAGLAVRRGDGPAPALAVHKEATAAHAMLKGADYRGFLAGALPRHGGEVLAIGHSRLVTNGPQSRAENNQPCADGDIAVVHNGIIVNDARLWARFPELPRQGEVDTEVLLRLLARARASGRPLEDAMAWAFGLLEGSASIAVLARDEGRLFLATNTGSLYFGLAGAMGLFASERRIAEAALASAAFAGEAEGMDILQVEPGTGRALDLADLSARAFRLDSPPPPRRSAPRQDRGGLLLIDRPPAPDPAWEPEPPALKRCARCILPESMPFMDFDADGVCRYCREYVPMRTLGKDALERALAPFRRAGGKPDCIVAFSGGRDSCYGLHYLKREMGMNPIAYSYDWGMVTDLARRNQARMCGHLGVEHILVSADIRRKRENIRRNVEAWLRKPSLGVIPLFMAGDKQFFWHANRLRKETGVRLVVYCENPLEVTRFKTGFLGIRERGGKAYNLPVLAKLRLGAAYAAEFLRNPAYLNRSLLDTASAYASTYFLSHDYLYLFNHVRWDEEALNAALLDGYGWETSPDTPSTWRIGDGSAAFYNYIYHTAAGFTEFDTFRSNQIREGLLGREEALRRVREENRPRWDSMREYAGLVGFDLGKAVEVIRAMPKAYGGRRHGD